jgi:hypothetical protein
MKKAILLLLVVFVLLAFAGPVGAEDPGFFSGGMPGEGKYTGPPPNWCYSTEGDGGCPKLVPGPVGPEGP